MKSIKTILLILASTSFIIVFGGAVYEHMVVVPKWKLAPPVSLTMFQGEYGLNPGPFWQTMHPVSFLLLIAALVANWKTARRKYIAITLAGYALVFTITLIYFVPELLSIIEAPIGTVPDKGMVARAGTWEILSLVRLAFGIGLIGSLLFSLTKDPGRNIGWVPRRVAQRRGEQSV